VGYVSSFVLAAGDRSNFTELCPTFAFIDLWSAGEDSFDDLHFFGLDDVALLIFLDNLFETGDYLAACHCHFSSTIIELL